MKLKSATEFVPGKVITLSTELAKPSPFYFGFDIEHEFVNVLDSYSFDKIFFFTEPHLFELYGKELYHKIAEKYPCFLEFVPNGEACKYFPVLEHTCEDLITKGVSKKSLLLAFGGGTVGNIVGLAAGLIYRGIGYIEVPTSMTGQTDSTLSNKQAVNGKTGKNHFGVYHSPIFIWSDTKYLKTEPPVSKRSGIIEGIKNGFISDASFLDYLDTVLNPQLKFSDEQLYDLAYQIILSKLEILKQDPSEKHYGIVLEYGHTFGHAIEWLEKGKMSHGEAVSFGMKIAAELAYELGCISHEDVDLHYYMIEEKLGFNRPLPQHITTKQLMNAMIADNKKTGEDIRFVILEKIGKCHNPEGDFLVTVDLNLVEKIVDQFIASQQYSHRISA
ncbi:2-deoxy-scyllo-inosose synthase [Aphanothece sacrum]|uniref:3-dehydroquinate synthase n=1 Tax=Aphanothece sacrum FPU1 TaxID=1920663 RepID=A0A401IKQ9_APHSA|nr:2-deoxy-scyllo-inosose synthase [Aphanothece sacrum]GBF81831.1 3-dehydroquinate synthase [Aphanothece sacrum FPU1]GBF84362.1 3-dehydroquinate synthase [Aphanothece sacrum FPU3]